MKTLEGHGFEMIKQGAEGKIYLGTYLGEPSIAKVRFSKSYRHADLDIALTKERIKAEARSIVRCQSAGIRTPALYYIDFELNCIFMEHINNSITVKDYIFKLSETIENETKPDGPQEKLEKLAFKIGTILAIMHKNNIIHGDLTTSNMLLQTKCDHENDYDTANIVMIDFGLSHVDSGAEDKGVDLYVLERALTSTHSILPHLFSDILEVYRKFDKVGSKEVLEKYEDIRARGRKRTMVG